MSFALWPKRHGYSLVAIFLGAVCACGGGDLPQEGSPAAKDSVHVKDSVPVISSPAADTPRVLLKESLRIQSFGGPTPRAFAQIAGIAVSASGDLFILDERNSTVVVFGHEGAFKQQFGRKGQGPGEFRSTAGMKVTLEADTLYVLERVLHAFSLDGINLFTSIVDSLKSGEPIRRVDAFVHIPGGIAVARFHPGRTAPTDKIPAIDTTIIQIRPAGGGYFSGPQVRLIGRESYGGGGMRTPKLLGPVPTFAVSRSGRILYSRGAEYVIDVMTMDGKLETQTVAAVQPVPLTSADFDRVIATFDSALAALRKSAPSMVPPGSVDLRKIPRAKVRSIVGRLLAGDGDTVLVERLDLGPLLQQPGAESQWDIVSIARGILGRFTMPKDFSPLYYGAGELYGVETGESGEQYVVRYSM